MSTATQYRPTPVREFKSELRKLTSLRSTWIQSAIVIVLYLLITFLIVQGLKSAISNSYASQEDFEMLGSSYIVNSMFQLAVLFGIAFGTMSMTAEYSHNTIQTSLLASRSRMAFYATKLLVLAVFWGAVAAVMLLLSSLLVQVTAGGTGVSLPFGDIQFWISLLSCVLVLVMTTLMSAAFGAVLRSTVGTVTLMFGLVLILPIVELIPLDFIDDLKPYFPINVMTAAVTPRDSPLAQSVVTSDYSLDPNVALLVLAAYTAVVIAFGAISLKRRDA